MGSDDDDAAYDRAVPDAVRGGLPRPIHRCALCHQSRPRPDLHLRPGHPILFSVPERAGEGLHVGQVPAVDPQEVHERLVRRRPPFGAPVLEHRHGDQCRAGRWRRRRRIGGRRRSGEYPPHSAGGAAAAADQAGQGAGHEPHSEAVRGVYGRDIRPDLPDEDALPYHRVVAPASVRLGDDPHPRGGRDGDVAHRSRGERGVDGAEPQPGAQVLGRALLVRHDAHLDWVRRLRPSSALPQPSLSPPHSPPAALPQPSPVHANAELLLPSTGTARCCRRSRMPSR